MKNNLIYPDEVYQKQFAAFLKHCKEKELEPVGFLMGSEKTVGFVPITPSAHNLCLKLIRAIAATPDNQLITQQDEQRNN